MENFEYQYSDAIRKNLRYGVKSKNRTGIDTIVTQHQYFLLENVQMNFPILKGKKINHRLGLIETFWFMNGFTDVKWLEDRGVNYWKEWANKEGTIGKSYGYQFRNFNGIDNFKVLLNQIKTNPESRRLILNLWNASEIDQMTLPPCVMNYRFACTPVSYGRTDKYFIDLHVLGRSEDSFLGLPYDFVNAAYFLNIVAYFSEKTCYPKVSYVPRNVHYVCEDFHLYENHIEQALQYLHNVDENKNNVIQQTAELKIQYRCLSDNKSIGKELDRFLKLCDENKYSDFVIKKNYEDQYGMIKAPIAV